MSKESSDDYNKPLLPLAQPLPPADQYEERIEYYKRKISYKAPITFRYGGLFGLGTGLCFALYKRSFMVIPKHFLFFWSTVGLGLCYEELYGIADNYYKLQQKK